MYTWLIDSQTKQIDLNLKKNLKFKVNIYTYIFNL